VTALLRRLADPTRPGSVSDRLRQRRFARFRRLVGTLPSPVRILDVGGTTTFWERVGWAGKPGFDIVLLNIEPQETAHSNIVPTTGDAADLSRYADNAFDVVVSNSVIEHLPTLDLQARMAAEVTRVGKRLYLQTPNRYFPLEPHFLFPFFAVLPIAVRVWLLRHMDLGWRKRCTDAAEALAVVRSVRLMTRSELTHQFPGAQIEAERFLLLPKSFIVLDGWDPMEARVSA
jgi:SAM-dependent methyltransferase